MIFFVILHDLFFTKKSITQMSENQDNKENKYYDMSVFNRGVKLPDGQATEGKTLCCGRCKLSQFDWLKDYENREVEGKVTTQPGMNDGVVLLVLVGVGRVDGLHA